MVYINMPVNLINGDQLEINESLTLPSLALGGTLYATADNGNEAYVNTTTSGRPEKGLPLFCYSMRVEIALKKRY